MGMRRIVMAAVAAGLSVLWGSPGSAAPHGRGSAGTAGLLRFRAKTGVRAGAGPVCCQESTFPGDLKCVESQAACAALPGREQYENMYSMCPAGCNKKVAAADPGLPSGSCWSGHKSGKCRFPSDAPRESCCKSHSCGDDVDCREFLPRFSEDAWKAAVKEAFCEPGKGCFDRSTDDVDEFVFSRTAPLMDARVNSAPGNRAISLYNLEKVAEFLKELAKRHEGVIPFAKRVNPGEGAEGSDESEEMEFRPRDVTMNEINGLLVLPLTALAQQAFTGFIGGDFPTYFVSHSWGGRFLGFVRSARAHFEARHGDKDPREVFYWVCTFANNQWRVKEELGPKGVQNGPFAKAISNVKSGPNAGGEIVAIQDDTSSTEFPTVSRQWCAFEMFFALMEGVPVTFACSDGALLGEDGYLTRRAHPGRKCRCSWKERLERFEASEDHDRGLKGYIGDRKDILLYIEDNTPAYCAKNQMKPVECLERFLHGYAKQVLLPKEHTDSSDGKGECRPNLDRSNAKDFSNILDFKDLPPAVQAAQRRSVDKQHYGSMGAGSFKHTGTK